MNRALDDLARELSLAAPEHQKLRYAFAHDCVSRVRHLLENPDVDDCLQVLGDWLAGMADAEQLASHAALAAQLANQHPGSKSIDGAGHAAVSAAYAVAKALEGKALDAASYAAYATVYAQGGYAAVGDPTSFEREHQWQVEALRRLAR
ncbi:MAG: hypothetical protein HY854_04415 [Burkholderiales bacterium]|nr:hypothetical protein [Burkholderiales bacterium]